MKSLVFLSSHPIQYFAPLYQHIVEKTDIPITVWYCSDESIKGKLDRGFGQQVKWDIPLLEGYESVFIKNNSWKPSIHEGFWGLINLRVIGKLYNQPKSFVIVSGWSFCTYVLAIIAGKLFGHTICLRVETPLNQELKKNRVITYLKNVWLRFLFLFIDRYLYIGKQNKLFYESFGKKAKSLVFTPYAVDNDRFQEIFRNTEKKSVREKLKLPADKKIILYSGKYIIKKRPLDLLRAFKDLKIDNAFLVFVGDGELRSEMEAFIVKNDLQNRVLLTGFINQHEIPLYYRAADIFVMCSGIGETWGLSVNEAMNFGLPVIVSDTCGSAYDLVDNHVNGAVFETGDLGQLTSLLAEFLCLEGEAIQKIEQASLKKIEQYSYDRIIDGLKMMRGLLQ